MDTTRVPTLSPDGLGDPAWHSQTHPRVLYMFLKHLWSEGHKGVAVAQMRCLATTSLSVVGTSSRDSALPTGFLHAISDADGASLSPITRLSKPEIDELRVRVHLRLGQWQQLQAEEVQQSKDMSATRYAEVFAPGQSALLQPAYCMMWRVYDSRCTDGT